jgi:hypothetical protein
MDESRPFTFVRYKKSCLVSSDFIVEKFNEKCRKLFELLSFLKIIFYEYQC